MDIVNAVRRFGLFLTASACVVAPALSQNSAPATKPSFEVASIKPTAPGSRGGGTRPPFQGDRFTMSGVTLRTLLLYAYRVGNAPFLNNQVIGAPPWIDNDRFDVQAKVDCDRGAVSNDQIQLMVQSMLEERFQLKAHVEKRELPMYDLIIAKDGPKLKASEDQTPTTPTATAPPGACAPPPTDTPTAARGGLPFDPRGQLPRGMVMMSFMAGGNTTLRTSAAPLTGAVNMLQNQAGRIINDKTGLKGLFDITLQFSNDSPSSPFSTLAPPPAGATGPGAQPTALEPLPTLTSAIQQLGLKLESTKGPVDVIVIESVQKPTED